MLHPTMGGKGRELDPKIEISRDIPAPERSHESEAVGKAELLSRHEEARRRAAPSYLTCSVFPINSSCATRLSHCPALPLQPPCLDRPSKAGKAKHQRSTRPVESHFPNRDVLDFSFAFERASADIQLADGSNRGTPTSPEKSAPHEPIQYGGILAILTFRAQRSGLDIAQQEIAICA